MIRGDPEWILRVGPDAARKALCSDDPTSYVSDMADWHAEEANDSEWEAWLAFGRALTRGDVPDPALVSWEEAVALNPPPPWSIKKLVKHLGGVQKVASRLNTSRRTVYHWISGDRMPRGPSIAALRLLKRDDDGERPDRTFPRRCTNGVAFDPKWVILYGLGEPVDTIYRNHTDVPEQNGGTSSRRIV